MNKKETIKMYEKMYGRNIVDLWDILLTLLDDERAAGYEEGHDNCMIEHGIGD